MLCALLRTEGLKKSLLHHQKNPLDIKNVLDLLCCVCMAQYLLQLPVFRMRNLKLVRAFRRWGAQKGEGGLPGATQHSYLVAKHLALFWDLRT